MAGEAESAGVAERSVRILFVKYDEVCRQSAQRIKLKFVALILSEPLFYVEERDQADFLDTVFIVMKNFN